jgi:hypothetical protein
MRRLSVFLIAFVFLANLTSAYSSPTSDTSGKRTSSVGQTIYPVYEISPYSTVVNLFSDFRQTSFASIFERFAPDSIAYRFLDSVPKNCYYVDTMGVYRLLKNDRLERETKKRLAKTFFIYGTKGAMQCPVKDVVFALDECRSSIFGFTIEGFDTARCGDPLLCSAHSLPLNYGNDYGRIEQRINSFLEHQPRDYSDSARTVVFANMNNRYLTYSDNFMWGHEEVMEKPKCFWPARSIFRVGNRTVKNVWVEELDLFGIPCD